VELKKINPPRSNRRALNYETAGQMKIQQMAFMIIAVFFFFVLVGLFLLNVSFKDLKKNAGQLYQDQAISSLGVIADMPELNFNSQESLTLDEDKLNIMSGNFGASYDGFWPVASVKVYKVYPRFKKIIKCPAPILMSMITDRRISESIPLMFLFAKKLVKMVIPLPDAISEN